MTQSLSTGTRKQKLLFKCITHDKAPIALSGSTNDLGNWDPAHALTMLPIPRPQGGFEWTAHIELPPGQTVEYKYVKKHEHGPQWETGNNHRITVIPGLYTLDSDFRE